MLKLHRPAQGGNRYFFGCFLYAFVERAAPTLLVPENAPDSRKQHANERERREDVVEEIEIGVLAQEMEAPE
jgi:hypothetical protein